MSNKTKTYKIFKYNSRLRKSLTQKKKTIIVAKRYLFVNVTYYLFIQKISNLLISVLNKTLKGIRGVRLDNRKVFLVHQVFRLNILSAFICRSINNHCFSNKLSKKKTKF